MSGARHVVAVDPLEFKREQVQIFGATHSAASIEEATVLVNDLTWGALADKVILTMGVAQGEYIQPALGMTKKGGRVRADGGGAVLRRQREHEPVRADDVREAAGRLDLRLRQPAPRHPRPLRLYQEGQLKLDQLVTKTYPIEDINVGYQAMRDGTNIRGMLIYDHSGNGS